MIRLRREWRGCRGQACVTTTQRHGRASAAMAPIGALLFFACGAAPPAELTVREQAAFRAAAAVAAPSVVSIETVGGLDTVGEVLVGTGPSSGVVVSDDGYIVSSTFNFAHRPASIIVVLPDGSRHPARLVARDESRKLVLLKIDAPAKLPVPAVATESEIAVGQWCTAVGRTFEPTQTNVSVGIVSAVHRIWGRALQTDAKISPANYGGALVDLQGRVLGVLVPLSPDHRSDVAGVEWYDSGIGFAVTLEHVNAVLPRLKAGETLKAGVIGVHFKGTNVYADSPLVLKCRAGSPAYDAGIRNGDLFTVVAGRPVEYQAQVMEQLQSRYAGDVVAITVVRGGETKQFDVTLVDALTPYRRPFFGLLAERTVGSGDGATITYVYQNSPAAEAGLRPGDVVVKFQDVAVRSRDELRSAAADVDPGETAKLEFVRDGRPQSVELTAAEETDVIPADVPLPQPPDVAKDDEPAAVKPLKIKVAEFKNEADLFVPPGYRDDVPHGVVVLLHPQGGFADRAIVDRWRERCRTANLLLLVPKAAAEQWAPTDLAFLKKAIDRTAESYRVDAARTAAIGYEEGGVVAVRAAAALRERIRAVAGVNFVPAGFNAENEPQFPTSFFFVRAGDFGQAARARAAGEQLRNLHFPVVERELPKDADDWNDAASVELLRWLVSLDRI